MLESNTTKGNNSPVQSNSGSNGLNVGGNVENLYYNTNPQDDIDLLSEIFDYIKQNAQEKHTEETKDTISIKEKASINFKMEDEFSQFRALYADFYSDSIYSYIGKFMETKENKSSAIGYIRKIYIDKFDNFQNKIDSCKNITVIASELIPPKHQKNPKYNHLATSLILFVFEMCDIGMKTEEEKTNSNYLF